MRLWSLHPKYLDRQGLVALWREALLAQAVLRGETRGYRNHPQLDRFRNYRAPLTVMSLYLSGIYSEAMARGYHFDRSKFRIVRKHLTLPVTSGQLEYEWNHLMEKLHTRSPETYQMWRKTKFPEAHPLMEVYPGDVEPWERKHGSA